jgi:hypothetical protein
MATLNDCIGSDRSIFQGTELSKTIKIPVRIAGASDESRTGYFTNTEQALHSLTSSSLL